MTSAFVRGMLKSEVGGKRSVIVYNYTYAFAQTFSYEICKKEYSTWLGLFESGIYTVLPTFSYGICSNSSTTLWAPMFLSRRCSCFFGFFPVTASITHSLVRRRII